METNNITPSKPSKPFYKRWWFITISVVIVLGILSSKGREDREAQEKDSALLAAQTERKLKESEAIKAKEAAEPKLEVISWKFTTDSELGFAFVEGRVKNISLEPLKSVQAVATFTTKNGDFVTSDDALLDYNPIMPGQTSNFKIIATYNPEMKSASLDFKELMGGAVPFKDK